MKLRHVLVAAAAATLSLGAIANEQQHSQSETTRPQASSDADMVRQAQDRLRAAGYPATPDGLREFQQAQGLEAHGKLDQQTLAALGVDTSASSSAATGASSGRDAQPSGAPTY